MTFLAFGLNYFDPNYDTPQPQLCVSCTLWSLGTLYTSPFFLPHASQSRLSALESELTDCLSLINEVCTEAKSADDTEVLAELLMQAVVLGLQEKHFKADIIAKLQVRETGECSDPCLREIPVESKGGDSQSQCECAWYHGQSSSMNWETQSPFLSIGNYQFAGRERIPFTQILVNPS